jgi:hypothetical protein
MKIVIDSTEYKTDKGLNKEDISIIKDLGDKGLIELHIPWFIYKECISTSIDVLNTEMLQIETSLKSFNRKGLDDFDYHGARSIAKEVEELRGEIKISVVNLWEKFVTKSKAYLYQFDEKESKNVFNSYFVGDKPFKSLKSRKDIPDAFIYNTILKISSSGVVHLISNDKNLCEAFADISNVVLHKTLKDLFQHKDFEEINTKYLKLKDKERIENAKELILENFDVIDAAVRDYTKGIRHLDFEDKSLRSDNNEGTINAIDNPKTTIDKESIKLIGEEFFVPVIVYATASIDYFVFKSDYWIYEDLPGIREDWNKHYYLVEDVVEICLKKTLIINMNEISEDEYLNIEIDEFDEMEIVNTKVKNENLC